MKDWGEDKGETNTIDIRCDRINNNAENGCGWTGTTMVITQLGATTWQVEDCPRCDGPIVAFDD